MEDLLSICAKSRGAHKNGAIEVFYATINTSSGCGLRATSHDRHWDNSCGLSIMAADRKVQRLHLLHVEDAMTSTSDQLLHVRMGLKATNNRSSVAKESSGAP